jgi:hypothetical protein
MLETLRAIENELPRMSTPFSVTILMEQRKD